MTNNHMYSINLEERSEGSPHRINSFYIHHWIQFLCRMRRRIMQELDINVCLSVCLFVRPFVMKTGRIFTQELKSGCPRGVFGSSSIPPKYLFLCTRRKSGFNKKIHTKLHVVYMYFQPNSCNAHADHEWAQGTFLRQRRKVPPAHAQRVYDY